MTIIILPRSVFSVYGDRNANGSWSVFGDHGVRFVNSASYGVKITGRALPSGAVASEGRFDLIYPVMSRVRKLHDPGVVDAMTDQLKFAISLDTFPATLTCRGRENVLQAKKSC